MSASRNAPEIAERWLSESDGLLIIGHDEPLVLARAFLAREEKFLALLESTADIQARLAAQQPIIDAGLKWVRWERGGSWKEMHDAMLATHAAFKEFDAATPPEATE